MDTIDAQIVELLRQDARSSYSDLGAAVGLSPDSVRQRMNKMEERDELRILGVIEPEALGYHVLATVTVQYRGDPAEFAQAMKPHECVTFLVSTIGRMNLLCEVAAEDDAELAEFVATKISTLPGVERFEVSRLVDVLKWEGAGRQQPVEVSQPTDFTQIDELDTLILRTLLYDPRMKVTKLAERVGCPYPTARRRAAALFERGIIQAVAVTERVVAGKHSVAALLLDTASREVWNSTLVELPGVNIVSRTLGASQGLLEIMSDTPEKLVDLIDHVAALPGVKISETLLFARSLVLPVSWRFSR